MVSFGEYLSFVVHIGVCGTSFGEDVFVLTS